jgi:hypothetical protein
VTLGGKGEVASGNEVAGIYYELSIPEADQSAVLDFANHFYSQSKVSSHFLVSVRVHRLTLLVEILVTTRHIFQRCTLSAKGGLAS